jgi:N-methylhydantoinase A
VLQDQKIEPTSAIIMGGPAPHLVDYLEAALGIPCRVPDHFEVANAVGAAVARVTCALTLQADTSRGFVVIPEANIQNRIGSGFKLEDAILLGKETLEKQAVTIGALREKFNITVTEKQIFNMIRGYSMAGRNIRLKMSLTPGLIQEWRTRDDA